MQAWADWAESKVGVGALSAASRLLLLVLCVLSDVLFVDHEAQGVAHFEVTAWFLRPFTRWDAAHYMNIASEGVRRDLELAFLPGYPAVVRVLGTWLRRFEWLGRADSFVLSALIVNFVCFIASTLVLVHLFEHLKVPRQLKWTAMLVHLLNPANVFFSTAYSESLYASISWLGILLLEKEKYATCWIFFLAASFIRSNGALNAIFPAADLCSAFFPELASRILKSGRGRVCNPRLALFAAPSFIAAILPHFLLDLHRHHSLCGTSNDYQSSHNCEHSRYWSYHGSYSYIQSKYWGVGMFNYYRIEQVPNFALAVPIFSVVIYLLFVNRSDKGNSKPSSRSRLAVAHCVHLALHALVALTWAHVQIATRLICAACPIIYLGIAHLFETFPSLRYRLALFLVGYNVLGILLHTNFFPWT